MKTKPGFVVWAFTFFYIDAHALRGVIALFLNKDVRKDPISVFYLKRFQQENLITRCICTFIKSRSGTK